MNALVTGVAGSGKTSLAKELKRRGYNCIDDATNGIDLGAWYDLNGNWLPDDIHHRINFSWENVRWGWDIEKLENFLEHHDPAIVCGYTHAVEELAAQYFDRVILLNAAKSLLNARLDQRQDGYGHKLSERKLVLEDSARLPERLAPLKPHIIEADQNVQQIAGIVIQVVEINDHS